MTIPVAADDEASGVEIGLPDLALVALALQALHLLPDVGPGLAVPETPDAETAPRFPPTSSAPDYGWPGAGPLDGDLGAVLRTHVLHQPILA
jgi:hypothetical protein